MKNEAVGFYAATWKLQGVRNEAQLDQILKALHKDPGIYGCEVSTDKLEVTYDPVLFTETRLKTLLNNAGSFDISDRLATVRRILPTRSSEAVKS